MSALRYAIEEAMASLWRGRPSGALSTMTIALALFVLGGFLIVASNLQRLGVAWGGAAEMSVYLNDEVTDADRAAIDQALTADAAVAGRDYLSKEEALTRFSQTFGDLRDVVDGVGGNPVPASYEVRIKTTAGTTATLDRLAATLRAMPGVSDVRYDRRWLDRLGAVVALVRNVGVALGLILALAAGMTVANVVRLALAARRDEVEIMQLVGAPLIYIRGPFVMEGLLQGGAGAVLALIALVLAFVTVRARYLVPLAPTIDLGAIRFLPLELCVLLILGGMLVGGLGGLLASWRQVGASP